MAGIKRLKTKALVTVGFLAALAMPIAANAVGSAVYDATPNPLAPNVASVGYEARSTSEFGDYVHLAGTNRLLNTVTVTMSDWALYSDYATDARYSANTVTWTHPVTINVYSNHLGTNGVPDTLLATKNQNVVIPWRPAAVSTCAGGTAWKASDGNCYNGKAFNATFDLTSLNVTLPNDVIVGVAYNTADYGSVPIHLAGPYNSLNVGVPTSQVVAVGTDDSTDRVFQNTSFAGFYADGGAGGVGVFRQDSKWAPNGTMAVKISASSVLPTNKNQCKAGGWKTFNNPVFKNQGACINWVQAKAQGNLKMSNPSQQIKFNIANLSKLDRDNREHNANRVEYWNYDVPGVLHYSADVICTNINPATKEARFMFQIPEGNPGLSGLYVVAYVKEVNQKHLPDLYGHAATADLATATNWCNTGVGFNPTMYPVTKGNTDIE